MIILIDDDTYLVDMFDMLLKDYEHLTLTSMEELKEQGEGIILKSDAIFTDMNLAPGVNAFSILKYAKGINPDIKVVLMTGHVPEDVTAERFDGLLLKPFRRDDLLKICDKFK